MAKAQAALAGLKIPYNPKAQAPHASGLSSGQTMAEAVASQFRTTGLRDRSKDRKLEPMKQTTINFSPPTLPGVVHPHGNTRFSNSATNGDPRALAAQALAGVSLGGGAGRNTEENTKAAKLQSAKTREATWAKQFSDVGGQLANAIKSQITSPQRKHGGEL